MRRARWGTGRFELFAMLGLSFCLAGFWPAANTRAAQKKPVDNSALEKEERLLPTKDNLNLHVTYYKSTMEKDAAVVVLLHMKDGNRFVWQTEGGFARRLQADGFAVITVDLRYHGENNKGGAAAVNANQGGGGKKKGKKAQGLDLKLADYEAMWEVDMEAVKAFIFEEHQAGHLNMNKMGIVGPEMGASIAVAFTISDWDKEPYDDGQPGFQTPRGQDVRALVLISPEEKSYGIQMAKLMPAIKDNKNIAVMICSGNDPKEEAHSKKIFNMVNPPVVGNKEKDTLNSERMYLKIYSAKLTGTDLLDKKEVMIEDYMSGFFDKYLKNLDIQWRDRKSKREPKKKN